LSAVQLEKVEGLTLHVRGNDMLDGTPVLDLKPYVAYTDSHPDAGTGWLEDAESASGPTAPADPVSSYAVTFTPIASEQAQWIESRTGLPIAARIRSVLALGPAPHPYRRIRRLADGMQLAVKEWRVRFRVAGREVHVLSIASGFRPSQLARDADDDLLRVHREFVQRRLAAGD
jgi:hypothetical protein